MNTYVVYHKDCYDGFCAAWVASKRIGKAIDDPATVFIPKAYGDPVPEFEGNYPRVYMVDFSYPRDVLIGLSKQVDLTVLDHHKTAKANCEGLDFCIFDLERSGAGLAYDYFYPEAAGYRPMMVDYTEDRDLWRFKLPYSREIFAWLASHPRDFQTWDQLAEELQDNFGGKVKEGEAILRYANQKVEESCAQVQFLPVGGYDGIPTVNVPYSMGSDTCHRLLALHPSAPFAAYYLDRGDGEQQWGLRGRDSDNFDVSEVAKTLGGGGHKKVAGFLKGKVSR